MKRYELEKILAEHVKWLRGEGGSGADLRSADLRSADLSGADLSGANLRSANLRSANLSGAIGWQNPSDWLSANFKSTANGLLVYKRIGSGRTEYKPPEKWEFKKGSVLTEAVNGNRQDHCGCGVNFGTKDWCEAYYPKADLWLCLIPWIHLASIIVPYNTDGKARCAHLELVRKIKKGE
jgi:uncharacterized protein YjbI with pentapeptide repeats